MRLVLEKKRLKLNHFMMSAFMDALGCARRRSPAFASRGAEADVALARLKDIEKSLHQAEMELADLTRQIGPFHPFNTWVVKIRDHIRDARISVARASDGVLPPYVRFPGFLPRRSERSS